MEDVFYKKICAVFADEQGKVHLSLADEKGSRKEFEIAFKPFAWSSHDARWNDYVDLAKPSNDSVYAPLDRLLFFKTSLEADAYAKNRDKSLPFFRHSCVENQFLISENLRMFTDMRFEEIRRLQLDIEVASEDGSFPDSSRQGD